MEREQKEHHKEVKDVQRVKIVGALWTFRNLVAMMRDLLIIVFIFVVIFGLLFLASTVSELKDTLGGLVGVPSVLNTLEVGGTESLIQDLRHDVNAGQWQAASIKLSQLAVLAQRTGSLEIVDLIEQLKQAVKAKNKVEFNTLLDQFEQQAGT